mmetsp:Transcript_42713/g.103011  ORF Transcript_42713/g.103011 Transcript_42713/m.103011 type:complete len:752 (-) Transcript_42713:61-2316(-)
MISGVADHTCSGADVGGGGNRKVRCDVCGFGTKHVSHKLVQCIQCDIYVHRECYCIEEFDEKAEFTCFACDAVGKTFEAVEVWKNKTAEEEGAQDDDDEEEEFEGDSENGRHEKKRDNFNTNIVKVKQRSRPRCCAFCSVRDGIHAMHPLFDNHGSRGRRIFKRNSKNKKELVWAHTLCAITLSTDAWGYLYGCYGDGNYDDEDENPIPKKLQLAYRNNDDRPKNPELTGQKMTDFFEQYGAAATHHFRCYICPPWGWTENKDGLFGKLSNYTQEISKNQEELFCSICGERDKKENFTGSYMNLRFSVSCKANDEDQYKQHKPLHDPFDTEECKQSFHIGCARWGGMNPQNLRRVYFFPGSEDTNQVGCVYCNRHAADIDETSRKNRKKAEDGLLDQKDQRKKKEQQERKIAEEQRIRQEKHKNQELRLIQQERKRKAEARAVKERQEVAKKAKTSVAARSFASRPLFSSNECSIDGMIRPPNMNGTGKERVAAPGSRFYKGSKDRHEELDASQAEAVNMMEKPTLKKKRRELADQNSASRKTDFDVSGIVDYLLTKSKDALGQPRVISDFTPARKHWKRKLSHFSSSDFMDVWNRAIFVYRRKLGEMKEGPPETYSPIPKKKFSDSEEAEVEEKGEESPLEPEFATPRAETQMNNRGTELEDVAATRAETQMNNRETELEDVAATDENMDSDEGGHSPPVRLDEEDVPVPPLDAQHESPDTLENLPGDVYLDENFILGPWKIVDPKSRNL